MRMYRDKNRSATNGFNQKSGDIFGRFMRGPTSTNNNDGAVDGKEEDEEQE